MEIFLIIVAGIIGAIVGSFLNVFILRYGTGKSFVSGRSFCFSCGKTLTAKELIPVFSYLFQRGRCTECGAKISIQYMLVELLTGLIFAISFWKVMHPWVVVFWFIWSLLIVITVYDFRHKIIPDAVVYLFSAAGLVASFFTLGQGGLVFSIPHWTNLIAGPVLFLPFFLLWYFSKGAWIGFGDAKLALGIGWFLGLTLGGSAIVYAFWIGAIFSVGVLIAEKHANMKTEIPFAPFLILGTLLAWLTEANVLQVVATLFPFLT